MERARSEEEEKGARIRGMMVDEGSICTSAASSSRPDVGREHPRGRGLAIFRNGETCRAESFFFGGGEGEGAREWREEKGGNEARNWFYHEGVFENIAK